MVKFANSNVKTHRYPGTQVVFYFLSSRLSCATQVLNQPIATALQPRNAVVGSIERCAFTADRHRIFSLVTAMSNSPTCDLTLGG